MKRTILQLVVALCVAGSMRADQTIQSVQQALADQGFYYGNVAGEKSAETTAAVRRYQIRNGLQVTGEINSETVRSLNVNSNSASSHPVTPTSRVTQPPLPVVITARDLPWIRRRVHLTSLDGGSRWTEISLACPMN
jgi:peptidoglycan hydrolase-like protein with peptidoglycan-binding domain